MPIRDVQRVESSDGHRIRLDIHRPECTRGTGAKAVIFVHGIFADRCDGNGEALADRIADEGSIALRFDLRGHGESAWPSTTFAPVSAARDVHAVMGWCQANSASASLLGMSFGGSIALTYLALNPEAAVSRMALLSPVIDYRATFIEPELEWGKGLFTEDRVQQLKSSANARLTPHFIAGASLYDEMMVLRPYEVLVTIKPEVLLLHGTEDDKVPVAAAREHRSRFSDSVTYLEVAGAGHSLSGSRVVNWLLSA
jgi:uncharacterized protein